MDEIDAYLVPLLDPKEIELLHPRLSDHHVAAVRKVERLSWIMDPGFSADTTYEILKLAVDPGDETGDVPWCRLLGLARSPNMGLQVARQWFAFHRGARYEQRPVSATVEAVAAYSVAAFEHLVGHLYQVGPWLKWASRMTAGEGRPGLDLVVYVRAVKLLQPVLARARR